MTPEEIEQAFLNIETTLMKQEIIDGPYAVLGELGDVENLRHEMKVMAKMIERMAYDIAMTRQLPIADEIADYFRALAEAELKGGE